MRLAQIRFTLPVSHPALGGESRSREHFRCAGRPQLGKDEETCEIETVGQFVKLTCGGVSRLVNVAKTLWADELPGIAQPQPQQGRRK